jgi:hypothetical protein
VTGATARQSFTRPIPPPQAVVEVFATPVDAGVPEPRTERSVLVGVSGAVVHLSWSGFGDDGSSSWPAPARLV